MARGFDWGVTEVEASILFLWRDSDLRRILLLA